MREISIKRLIKEKENIHILYLKNINNFLLNIKFKNTKLITTQINEKKGC